jgi:uncharacterized protein YraI
MKKILLYLSILLTMFCIKGSAYVRYVTVDINLRYGPGVEYGVITSLPKGTAVTIDEDCDCKWVPVEYCGYIGYISTKFLSKDVPNGKVKSKKRVQPTYHSVTYSSHRRSARYYTNVDGYMVQPPTRYNTAPADATALCRDSSYSFSINRRGTCSHHGGVSRWL